MPKLSEEAQAIVTALNQVDNWHFNYGMHIVRSDIHLGGIQSVMERDDKLMIVTFNGSVQVRESNSSRWLEVPLRLREKWVIRKWAQRLRKICNRNFKQRADDKAKQLAKGA